MVAAMKPAVLMVAYACDPGGTGEHWLGWGWAEQAAQAFQLDLITTSRAKTAVSKSCAALGIVPHFIDSPAWLRRLTEAAGGSWFRKLAWQGKVGRLAAQLHRERSFALVHQTTFHTFRVPFAAARLEIPSVWGPIAGGESVPPGFEALLGSARHAERGRQLSNRLWLQSPAVCRSLRAASRLFVSNRTTLDFLPSDCRAKSTVVPPNALRPADEAYFRPPGRPAANADGVFRLLYVGNCVSTRSIPLVLEALRHSGLQDFELSVVGNGPALAGWKRLAGTLGLAAKVNFTGKVAYAELGKFYETADVLVFPALRDSGGSSLLEAMARYVPVVCLDWGGPGEMLDAQSGVKIPVTTAEETVQRFGAALAQLRRTPALRQQLAEAARQRAEACFRWQSKRELLERTYSSLIRK